MKKRILLIITFILMFTFVTNVNAEELIKNGGFELPSLGTKTWDTFTSDHPDLGWTVEYVNPIYGPGRLEIQKNAAGAPNSGLQHAELDSYHNVMIYQDIVTKKNTEYYLTYYWSPRPNVAINAIDVYWNDVKIATHTMAGGATTMWQEANFVLQSNDIVGTIKFIEVGTDNSLGMYLDDVSIVEIRGEIIAPVASEVIEGLYTLKANYFDGEADDYDIPYWAIREGSCGGKDVFSWSMNGFPLDWDNENFNFEIDTTKIPDGKYCFVWNPNTGLDKVRDTKIFYVENDTDNDGVLNTVDMCSNTTIDEVFKLGTNRFELRMVDDKYTWVQNKPAKQDRITPMYDLSYTYGCSGTQILQKYKDMGEMMEGHWKFGLSSSVIADFRLMYQ
jgi:hypothetical protein